jgi:hypothetical protein
VAASSQQITHAMPVRRRPGASTVFHGRFVAAKNRRGSRPVARGIACPAARDWSSGAGSRDPSAADESPQGVLEVAPHDFDHPAFLHTACRLIRQGEFMLGPTAKPPVI